MQRPFLARLPGVLSATLLLLSALALWSFPSSAAAAALIAFPETWNWQNPAPSGNTLRAVSFPTTRDGWAVGGYGVIYASNDGGAHWWPQRAAPTNNFSDRLQDVFFVNANRGWTVGREGVIRMTTNGGASWATQDSGATADLHAVCFANSSVGWAVGDYGLVLHTTDGGASWTPQASGSTAPLTGVACVSENRAWATEGGSGILRTVDGGSHWTRVDTGAGHGLEDIDFVSGLKGWAVGGYGTILATTDGGRSWSPQTSPATSTLTGVAFIDTLNGWACGPGGDMIVTDDGGATWDDIYLGDSGVAYDVAMPSVTRVRMVGARPPGAAAFTSLDGGASWHLSHVRATDTDLRALSLRPTGRGWAVGESGMIVTTTDSGDSWQWQASGRTDDLSDVCAAGSTRAYAVGNDAFSRGFVISTSDGTHWTTAYADHSTWLSAADFVTSLRGWVVGGSTVLLVTTDGGAHWGEQYCPGPAYDVDFIDASRGWVLNDGGTMGTTDGGLSWTIAGNKPAGWVGSIYAIAFADRAHGWMVGQDGQVARTNDGGDTWVQQSTDVGVTLRDVGCSDATHAWAVGDFGVILRTIDGGAHWRRQYSTTQHDLAGMDVVGGDVWTVGEAGTILSRHLTAAPQIVRLSPTSGKPGTTLTIYGWGFGASRGSSSVKIGTKTVATYRLWSNMRIKVKVPAMAVGKKRVRVTVGGTTANVRYFRVR